MLSLEIHLDRKNVSLRHHHRRRGWNCSSLFALIDSRIVLFYWRYFLALITFPSFHMFFLLYHRCSIVAFGPSNKPYVSKSGLWKVLLWSWVKTVFDLFYRVLSAKFDAREWIFFDWSATGWETAAEKSARFRKKEVGWQAASNS